MAGAASSSSSSENYDVFLSFRGEDTRRNFVSHLYTALFHKQIRTYKDNINLEKGDEVWPALVRAIENSHICIVVFSKDYASSTWCLNELTQILHCKQEGEIIPVFYEIEPTHVRHQTASYQQAFEEYEKKFDEETVSKWKASLKKAADFSGFDSQSKDYSDDSHFIDEIVEKVLQRLSFKYPPKELAGLIGIEENIRSVESLLQEVQTIGIWGMGGIGKTTLARAVFDKLSRQYDGCYFLANVREESRKHGLDDLRKKLLSKLLDGKDISEEATPFAESRLKLKKVLIVLDDVDDSEQLEKLIGDYDCLSSNSRLIMTTRDKQVLISREVQKIYEVYKLEFEESFKLFSMHAFSPNHPKIEFEELTRRAVDYARGIPLALKILGSSLRSQSKKTWERALEKLKKYPNEKIQNVLRLSYDGLDFTEKKIFLDIACFFKGEDKDFVISILDACDFFAANGIETLINRALITLKYDGKIDMHDLIEEMGKTIVREESNNDPGKRSRLWDAKDICDVLQHNKGSDSIEGIILDMSTSGNLQLNADSFKKMRNLRFLKFYHPLYGSSCTVSSPPCAELFFNKLSYFQWDDCPWESLPSTFSTERLVELHMTNSHIEKLCAGVKDTVNLRINLLRSKRLIEFPNLSNSSNLELIDLKYSHNLCSVDLSNLCLPNLKVLDLSYCGKLERLLGETPLKSLRELNVKGCSSLKEFSLSSEEIKWLDLTYTKIETLLPSIGKCNKLEGLYLPVSIKNLPDELSKLRSLWYLGLHYCKELDIRNLHIKLDRLQSLEKVDLSGCNFYAANGLIVLQNKALITIVDGRVEMHDLIQEMGWKVVREQCIEDLESSRLRNLWGRYYMLKNNKGIDKIEGMILNLSQMQDLHFSDDAFEKFDYSSRFYDHTWKSREPIDPNMLRLELMNISDSQCLICVPAILCSKNVVRLVLRYSCITKLWDGEQNLERLKEIDLRGCCKLVELPNLSTAVNLELIDLSICDSLRHLPAICFEKLVRFVMRDSPFKKLWDGVQNLVSLEEIDLAGSKKLIEVPDLSRASKLRVVDLSRCENLCQVHPSLLPLQSHYELNLSWCKILQSGIPLDYPCILNLSHCSSLTEFSLNSVTKLKTLYLSWCKNLESFQSGIPLDDLCTLDLSHCSSLTEFSLNSATKLKTLNLSGCENLESFQSGIPLDDLCILDLSHCSSLREFSLNSATKLKTLNLSGCENLESFQSGIPLDDLCILDLSPCSSLREFSLNSATKLETLDLSGTAIEKLDSSNGRFSNLQSLDLSNSQINSLPDELPALYPLKRLDLAGCRELDTTNLHIMLKDSIFLRYLCLRESRVESLPDCVRNLSFLEYIDVSYCKRLQSILGLPLSLKVLNANGCTCLEVVKTAAVLDWGTSLEPSIVEVGTSFLWTGVRMSFKNCESLTPGSIYDIESDAHKRMMVAAACQCDHPIEFCFQGIGVPTWFRYRAEGSSTIEVPSDSEPLGFAFCLVLSLGYSLYDGKISSDVGIKCKCWLEGRKNVTSESDQHFWYSTEKREGISNHVILWYNESDSEAIMNAITDSRAKDAFNNPKLSFQFSVSVTEDATPFIKECGVWPIHASEIEYKANVLEEWLEIGRDMDRPGKELKPSFLAKISELELGTKSYSTSEIGVADAQIKHVTERSSKSDIRDDEVWSEDASSESQNFVDENELALEADQEEKLLPTENLSSSQEIQDKQEQLLQPPTKMQRLE